MAETNGLTHVMSISRKRNGQGNTVRKEMDIEQSHDQFLERQCVQCAQKHSLH